MKVSEAIFLVIERYRECNNSHDYPGFEADELEAIAILEDYASNYLIEQEQDED